MYCIGSGGKSLCKGGSCNSCMSDEVKAVVIAIDFTCSDGGGYGDDGVGSGGSSDGQLRQHQNQ